MASDDRVQVYAREGGLELTVDGTFASWYEPGSPRTGGVWDALSAGLLLLPPRRRRRVLILGLGGGSAARLVRALAPDASITGVEYDPEVVQAARDHFDLDALDLEVFIEDARTFLMREKRRFDFVIDDVFIGNEDDVRKPDWMFGPDDVLSHAGLDLAVRRVASGGVFSCNSIDEAPRVQRKLGGLFPHLLKIEVEDYDNRIFLGSSALVSAREFRAMLKQDALLKETLPELSVTTVG